MSPDVEFLIQFFMYTAAGERAECVTIHYAVTNLFPYFQQHAFPFSFSIAAGVSNPHDFGSSNVALLLIVSLSLALGI